MVWHLHIGLKLRSLEPPEVLSQIWPDLVKKLKPPERPLLEVRRFFQWCQGMSLGILKRFWEKKVNFLFDFVAFVPDFQDLRPSTLTNIWIDKPTSSTGKEQIFQKQWFLSLKYPLREVFKKIQTHPPHPGWKKDTSKNLQNSWNLGQIGEE